MHSHLITLLPVIIWKVLWTQSLSPIWCSFQECQGKGWGRKGYVLFCGFRDFLPQTQSYKTIWGLVILMKDWLIWINCNEGEKFKFCANHCFPTVLGKHLTTPIPCWDVNFPTSLPCSKASPALRAFLSSNCMLIVTLWGFYLLSWG